MKNRKCNKNEKPLYAYFGFMRFFMTKLSLSLNTTTSTNETMKDVFLM